MCSKRVILVLAFALTAGLSAGFSETVVKPAHAQASGVSKADMQNIQRLLKLLADRYPKTYGSVDPGRIDGSYGDGTKDAIRNFQKISGSSSGPAQSEQLEADILAALAQMSATQTAETDTVPDPAKTAPPAPQAAAPVPAPTIDLVPTDQKTASPTAPATTVEASAPEAPKKQAATKPATAAASAAPPSATPPSATPAKSVDAAAAKKAPAVPAPRPTPTPVAAAAVTPPEPAGNSDKSVAAEDKPETPALGARIYFVQAASLRSLESAKREWQRIFDENRAALTGEQVYFERADIAKRGVFYRILIGPMAEAGSARTLCTFLKKNDQTCVVTVRKRSDLPKPGEKTGSLIPGNEKAVAAVAPKEPPAQEPPAAAQAPVPGVPATPPGKSEIATGRTGDATKQEQKDVATLAPQAAAPSGGGTPTPPATTPPVTAPQVTTPPVTAPKVTAPLVTPPVVAPTSDTAAPVTQADPLPAPTVDFGDLQSSLASETIEIVESTGTAETASPAPTAEPVPPPAGATAESAPPLIAIKGRGISLQTLGIAAAAIVAIIAAAVFLRRRNRKTAFSQLLQPGALALVPEAAGVEPADDALAALETDFDSAQLKRSRMVRDEFLRDVLGEQKIEADDLTKTDDSAIRINNRLKSLLASDPAQYKSIFLNWVFLSKIGTALNDNEITLEQINGHFGREFNILQNYFKIHLLELDDRHRIRKELPGLYYCLQLAQQKQREGGRAPSAA